MKYLIYTATTLAGIALLLLSNSCTRQEQTETVVIPDSSAIFAINHIGLTVRNLDEMLDFYRGITGFKVLDQQEISNDPASDRLLGMKNAAYKKVVLQAPNMLFELTEFQPVQDTVIEDMPPEGPGMTHTCFQSPSWDSGYDKFIGKGLRPLSKGDHPIDIGGYGVTYAYAHDPEGNMVELEQIDQMVLTKSGRDSSVLVDHPLWMTQVALMSPDVDRLADFYENLLSRTADRRAAYKNNPKLDSIANRDSMEIKAVWIKMDGPAKMMELMQYVSPKTGPSKSQKPTDLGYHFSYETPDIRGEYLRMQKEGVELISEPQDMGKYLAFYARDVDGNLFAVRQIKDAESPLTSKNFLFTQS